MKQYKILPIGDVADLVNYRPAYGTVLALEDGRKFIHCYTALTSLVKGGCVCISFTPGAAAGQNPRATVPATTGIYHHFGIAAETVAAAGGIWVQVAGRCTYARVDGGSAVAIGNHLKPVNAKQYLALDHATTATASMMAASETAEATAVAAQTDVTNGDADNTILLPDRWATVA